MACSVETAGSWICHAADTSSGAEAKIRKGVSRFFLPPAAPKRENSRASQTSFSQNTVKASKRKIRVHESNQHTSPEQCRAQLESPWGLFFPFRLTEVKIQFRLTVIIHKPITEKSSYNDFLAAVRAGMSKCFTLLDSLNVLHFCREILCYFITSVLCIIHIYL